MRQFVNYVSKPLFVKAVQWFQKEHLERQNFKPGCGISDTQDPLTGVFFKFSGPTNDPIPLIRVGKCRDLESVQDGDWIITDADGYISVVEAERFDKLYMKLMADEMEKMYPVWSAKFPT